MKSITRKSRQIGGASVDILAPLSVEALYNIFLNIKKFGLGGRGSEYVLEYLPIFMEKGKVIILSQTRQLQLVDTGMYRGGRGGSPCERIRKSTDPCIRRGDVSGGGGCFPLSNNKKKYRTMQVSSWEEGWVTSSSLKNIKNGPWRKERKRKQIFYRFFL